MSGAAAFSQQEIYFPASSAVGANDLITRIDFSAPGLGTGPVNLISGAAGITKPGAMVVDFSDGGSMFFADGLGADASIKTAGLGGPGAATTVVQLGVNVSSLALDRSGQIIYFTTSSAVAANNQIMRVSYEGTKLTVLFPASAGVTRPTALAVDVAAGIMFFADGVGPSTFRHSSGDAIWILRAALPPSLMRALKSPGWPWTPPTKESISPPQASSPPTTASCG